MANRTPQGMATRARYTMARYDRNRAVVNAFKDRPCADCGGQWPPAIMHCDHRDPSQKLFTVGNRLASRTEAAVRAELEKCDVVCSNCHGLRHYYGEQGHSHFKVRAVA